MKLIYESNHQEVKIGDSILSAGQLPAKVMAIVKPHKPSSTGRVRLMTEDSNGCPSYAEYFPGVINAKWIEREDRMAIEEREDREMIFTYEMQDDSFV